MEGFFSPPLKKGGWGDFKQIVLLLIGLWLLAAAVHAQTPIPPLEARVTDLTGTLSAEQRENLEQRLKAFEDEEGAQIAVLIVPTTEPEAIEQYSIRVVENWKLGREDVDDGALLLIAKQDRELRIEVGYGLEGALTDATSNRIIEDIIAPHFKNNDFYGGIRAGTEAMMKVIAGEPLPAPQQRRSDRNDGFTSLLPIVLILAFIVGNAVRGIAGRLPAAFGATAVATLILWLLLGSLLGALLFGLAIFFFVLMSGSVSGFTRGGYYSGGFGSGGFSSGGGFGGGGASGSW